MLAAASLVLHPPGRCHALPHNLTLQPPPGAHLPCCAPPCMLLLLLRPLLLRLAPPAIAPPCVQSQAGCTQAVHPPLLYTRRYCLCGQHAGFAQSGCCELPRQPPFCSCLTLCCGLVCLRCLCASAGGIRRGSTTPNPKPSVASACPTHAGKEDEDEERRKEEGTAGSGAGASGMQLAPTAPPPDIVRMKMLTFGLDLSELEGARGTPGVDELRADLGRAVELEPEAKATTDGQTFQAESEEQAKALETRTFVVRFQRPQQGPMEVHVTELPCAQGHATGPGQEGKAFTILTFRAGSEEQAKALEARLFVLRFHRRHAQQHWQPPAGN